MSLLFGGKEILCDGCGSKICDAPNPHTLVGEYPYRHQQLLSDVFPTGAIVIKVTGWFDDSGPESPARAAGDSLETVLLRHFCPTCAPVASDKLKQEFQRPPLVDQLAERE